MAHISQSRPDYGLGLKVVVLESFEVVRTSLGSLPECRSRRPSIEGDQVLGLSFAARDESRQWNVSRPKWNLC